MDKSKCRVALLQMCSSFYPKKNADLIAKSIKEASEGGARIIFTPEMSNIIDSNRERLAQSVSFEEQDSTLHISQELARKYKIWVSLGSLAIKNKDGSYVNCSFIINSGGEIVSRYNKIHMFDVDLQNGERWRESDFYTAGINLGVAEGTPLGRLGLAICYDIRFPALFEMLGRMQCDVMAIPSAFTVPTGEAHWHVLQRARAIESCAFVISAAQAGTHDCGRTTYGHSIVVSPWGTVLLDMEPNLQGVGFVDLNLKDISSVRNQIPSIKNKKLFSRFSFTGEIVE